MPIDAREPLSDGWWLKRLTTKLTARQPECERLDRYFRGDPPLPGGQESARPAFQAFQKQARLNLAELIVEACRERMIPTGIRTAASDDEMGDDAARIIWKRNAFDVEIADTLQTMLSLGDSYVIVGKDADGKALLTSEDPRQVVTEHDPTQQRRIRAACKVFHDDVEGRDLAYLYLPADRENSAARVRVAYRDVTRGANNATVKFNPTSWAWLPELSGPIVGLTEVPVVRFRNKRGVGEFEPHTDVLDRINFMILQRMVIATMQAFRQRAVMGDLPDVYPPGHPEAGAPINYDEVFAADPGALWLLPETAKMWESGQADLGPVLNSVKDDVQHIAAVTRTPMHYLMPDAANGSAEGASTMREGLVFRAEDRITRANNAIIDVMAHAFRIEGDRERANRDALQVLWAPAERRSLAERADASAKAGTEIPWRTKMIEIWQFTPKQVDEMESERMTDTLMNALTMPPPAPAPTPGEAPAPETPPAVAQ